MVRPLTVASGVQSFPARTPTLPPATHTNSYALGSRDVLLVEPATPYEDERRDWLEWARSFPSSGRRLVGLFLTHHHADHVGGAKFFSRELGVQIWAHSETASRLPDVEVHQTLAEGDTLELDGPEPQSWRVMHTPGHAPGHLCLFECTSKSVIVGDMVASVGTILVGPDDGDMAEYITQLGRLRSLEAHTALPAHGNPIENPGQLFGHYVLHRLRRETMVLAALEAAGPSGASGEELLPSAYADTPEAAWPLAALSIQAHLVKLVREGRAHRDGSRYTFAERA